MYVSMRLMIASKEVAPPINDNSSLEHSQIETKSEQIKKKKKKQHLLDMSSTSAEMHNIFSRVHKRRSVTECLPQNSCFYFTIYCK